jgi:hypothetical protein
MSIPFQFMVFYFINLLLDYPLQCEFQKKYKSEYHTVMLVHCMIWGFGLSIALFYLGCFAWWKTAFLVIGHFLVDTWKARGWYKGDGRVSDIYAGGFRWLRGSRTGLSDGTAYIIDQLFHLIQLIIVFFTGVK